MADQRTAPLGHEGPGEPGSSLRGVTGREQLFGFQAAVADKETEQLFDLPVDSEHKATRLKLWSIKQPHMRSFHLSWMAFFCSFCSAFAAPPLIPIIRDNINLTKSDVGNAGIASISGAIASRLLIGPVCDLIGPRFGAAFILMGVVPCICSMANVSDVAGFTSARFFIGLGLACFVTCQYWMSSMFNSKIVGLANGTAAGWGNLGGGFIQLVMPAFYALIRDSFSSPHFTAWRIAFYIPAVAHIVMGLVVLTFGQDHPDGQYLALSRSGQRKVDKPNKVLWVALTNYRAWILALTYGYCFGTELTADNILANYFYDRFNLDVSTAGSVAASFGLMNIFSRPSGGILSDLVGRRFGMRGRLWILWVFQTMGGILCIVLGRMSSLGGAVAVMLLFSYFVQAACGTTFGVVPFVSRRALGIVSGMTGAGGNAGSAIMQAIFFSSINFKTQDGLSYMGIVICGVTLTHFLLYFPQWGGMLFGPSHAPTATEEGYYASEYTEEEKAQNLHASSMKFAANAQSERGRNQTLPAEQVQDPAKAAV